MTVLGGLIAPGQSPRFSVRRWPANGRAIRANFQNRWKRRTRSLTLPAIPVVAVIVLLVLAALVFPYDEAISRWARTWPAELVMAANYLTHLAKAGTYLVGVTIMLCFLGAMSLDQIPRVRFNKIVSWIGFLYLILFALLFSEIIGILLKYMIGRARPSIIDMYGMNTFRPFGKNSFFASLPSGHSTDIAALATVLAFVFRKWRFAFAAAAVALASTRVALQEHFPSDVLAGLALGTLIGASTVMLFVRLRYVFRPSANGSPMLKTSFRLAGSKSDTGSDAANSIRAAEAARSGHVMQR